MAELPSDNTTTAVVTVGGSFSDVLEAAGDRDWIRIDLAAGQTVYVTLEGAGANPVSDTYVYIYDSIGVKVAENDDIRSPSSRSDAWKASP